MKLVKRVMIAAAGGIVLCIGVAMIILPGPAALVIPAGLAILAIEFAWAKRWLQKLRNALPAKFRGSDSPKTEAIPTAASGPANTQKSSL